MENQTPNPRHTVPLRSVLEEVRKPQRASEAMAVADLLREFGGITDLLGSESDVELECVYVPPQSRKDKGKWNVTGVVRKRPVTLEQFSHLCTALRKLREYEEKLMKQKMPKGRGKH